MALTSAGMVGNVITTLVLQSSGSEEISLAMLQVAAFLLPTLVLLIQLGTEYSVPSSQDADLPITNAKARYLLSPIWLGLTGVTLLASAGILCTINVLAVSLGFAISSATLSLLAAFAGALVLYTFLIIVMMVFVVYSSWRESQRIERDSEDEGRDKESEEGDTYTPEKLIQAAMEFYEENESVENIDEDASLYVNLKDYPRIYRETVRRLRAEGKDVEYMPDTGDHSFGGSSSFVSERE